MKTIAPWGMIRVENDRSGVARRDLMKSAAVGGIAISLVNNVALARSVMAGAGVGPQRDMPFDDEWLFHLGDIENAQAIDLRDGGWRKLSLPHDWSIEDRIGAPKEAADWTPPVALWNSGGHPKDARIVSPEVPIVMASVPPPKPGGPPRKVGPFDVDETAFGWGTGWTVGGIGWYRKRFTMSPLAKGEQVEIRFDGAYLYSDVWLNGVKLGRNTDGYMGFAFDLTPHLNPVGPNVLAVRVANVGETARWYSGSGIYRHVWLSRTGAVRIPLYGVAITTPSASAASAALMVAFEVANRAASPVPVDYAIEVSDARGGGVVARGQGQVAAAAGGMQQVRAELTVANPALWSPDQPSLYHADIVLSVAGKVSDRLRQRFGIRSIAVSPAKGFQVNGKTFQLKGACVHHDNGFLGAVAIDRAERRKVELLKANGFNAVRCSHNPPSPYFLDACDELGMIVMDEAFDVWEYPKLLKDYYNTIFADNWRRDLANMVRRDRNHASIAFWSIGNEIHEAIEPRGVALATQMRAVVREQDPSRFITQAITASYAGAKGEAARAQLDVTSYNYSFNAVEKDSATYPNLTFTTTETHSADAFDIRAHMDRNPAYMGEFLWTGIDYIGEVGVGSSRLRSDTKPPEEERKIIFGMDVSMLNFYVWDYPAYQSGSGEIDLIGLKKPPSYYRDVVWDRSKLEMFVQRPVPPGFHEDQTAWGWPDVLPSWTWPQGDPGPMVVHVYSSADEVALELNGKEVGRQRLTARDKRRTTFNVPYHPGELVATAYAGGAQTARQALATVGAPAKLMLRTDRQAVNGSSADLAYVYAEVCDADGNIVPDAAVPLTFGVAGAARLRAAGSANPYGVESFQDNLTRTFHGRALAILQPTARRGQAELRVSSPGLQSASTVIQVMPVARA